MTQTLYYWDESKHFSYSEFYLNEADVPTPLPANATTLAPESGLYEPISWDGSVWIGADKADWLAAHPAPTPEPTDQDKTNASLMLQIAQNKSEQEKFSAQVLLQIATLNGGTK